MCAIERAHQYRLDIPIYLIYDRDPSLPQDLFLLFKSGNMRQIKTEDVVENKMKLLKELHAAYEKLNQDKKKKKEISDSITPGNL